jgi:hypothetical protein
MIDHRTDPSLKDLNRGMLVVARADLTAGQVAKLKWEQARAAAGAGAGAWRDREVAGYSPRSSAGSLT